MSVLKKLDKEGIVAYKTAYAKIPGSDPMCALFLSQVCYWCAKMDDGVAWITHQAMFEQTGMTRKQQDRAAEFWASVGIINKFVKGIPPKIHYFVDFDALEALILRSVLLVHMPERDILDVPKVQHVMSERDKTSRIDSRESERLCVADNAGGVEQQSESASAISDIAHAPTPRKQPRVAKSAIPKLADFVEWARARHPEYDAESFYKRMESQDWLDGRGAEIKNLKSKFNTFVENGWAKKLPTHAVTRRFRPA